MFKTYLCISWFEITSAKPLNPKKNIEGPSLECSDACTHAQQHRHTHTPEGAYICHCLLLPWNQMLFPLVANRKLFKPGGVGEPGCGRGGVCVCVTGGRPRWGELWQQAMVLWPSQQNTPQQCRASNWPLAFTSGGPEPLLWYHGIGTSHTSTALPYLMV